MHRSAVAADLLDRDELDRLRAVLDVLPLTGGTIPMLCSLELPQTGCPGRAGIPRPLGPPGVISLIDFTSPARQSSVTADPSGVIRRHVANCVRAVAFLISSKLS